MSSEESMHMIRRLQLDPEAEQLIIARTEEATGSTPNVATEAFLFAGQQAVAAATAVAFIIRGVTQQHNYDVATAVANPKNGDSAIALISTSLAGTELDETAADVVGLTNRILEKLRSPYHLPEE